jgi:hypothetical protein
MKRSEINALIRDGDAFVKQHQFYLPPFAYWSPQDWQNKGEEAFEIYDRRLGWDITDFGLGKYQEMGLLLFTMRNGHPDNLRTGKGKTYCEKMLLVGVKQIVPLHYHWVKTEDIINRGGGDLAIQLYNGREDGGLYDTPVTVSIDAVKRTVDAGGVVVLKPGESITLEPYCYHKFWGEGSRVLVGEVSLVNDDNKDNKFYEPMGRFPTIEEDEPPLHLLVNDYEQYYPLAQGKSAKGGY